MACGLRPDVQTDGLGPVTYESSEAAAWEEVSWAAGPQKTLSTIAEVSSQQPVQRRILL